MRYINNLGRATLKLWESGPAGGGKPALKAYLDSVGVPTIGFGHTKGVRMGDTCTLGWAEQWLSEDLAPREFGILTRVLVPLTDNQFAALVMWAFNVPSWETSTLIKLLNYGDYASVPIQLRRWNKGRVNGKLQVIKGLVNRREAEIKLWNTL